MFFFSKKLGQADAEFVPSSILDEVEVKVENEVQEEEEEKEVEEVEEAEER